MATIRAGNQSVLLVVDVQVGVMRGAWRAEDIIASIACALEKVRQAGRPVIWVQHTSQEMPHGSLAWQLVPGLRPAAGEIILEKNYNSCFEDTTLEATLARLGATHLILAGAATNWCIRASAYATLERGYDLTLLQDAHTTEALELEDGTTIEAESIIRELNTVMNWLRYPGRRNIVLPVTKLAFPFPEEPA